MRRELLDGFLFDSIEVSGLSRCRLFSVPMGSRDEKGLYKTDLDTNLRLTHIREQESWFDDKEAGVLSMGNLRIVEAIGADIFLHADTVSRGFEDLHYLNEALDASWMLILNNKTWHEGVLRNITAFEYETSQCEKDGTWVSHRTIRQIPAMLRRIDLWQLNTPLTIPPGVPFGVDVKWRGKLDDKNPFTLFFYLIGPYYRCI